MGIPYIQLDSDFVTSTAKMIAALLRIRRREVVGMAADLIAFAIAETSTKETPPTGLFVDPDATTILEAAMEWEGEQGKAVDAFERAGLLEKLEVGYRVRGCDRYRATWEKNNRRKTGRKPDGNRTVTGDIAPGNRTEPVRNRPLDGDGDGDEQKQLQQPVARKPVAAPGLTPAEAEHRNFQQAAWAEAFASLPTPTPNDEFSGWYRGALAELAKLGKGDHELRLAYRAFLADPFWSRDAKRRCPWVGWVKQWRDFLPAAVEKPRHKPVMKPQLIAEGGGHGAV